MVKPHAENILRRSGKRIYITPDPQVFEGLRWLDRLESGVILSRHTTKSEAVVEARRLAMQRRTVHVVYREDGLVEAVNDYS